MCDESERTFTAQERRIAEKLVSEGRQVKALPETGTGSRYADAEVDGISTEFKTVRPGASSATNKNEINDSVRGKGQARHMIIDTRDSSLTEAETRRGLARAKGISRGKIDSVRIIGQGFDFTSTDFK